jgi:hypothetical protein
MSQFIVSLLFVFSAFAVIAEENIKFTELSITHCDQRGWSIQGGFDWEELQCEPSQEVQIELTPIQGRMIGEWQTKRFQGRVNETIHLEESDISECKITLEIQEPNSSVHLNTLINQPCTDLKNYNGSELTSDNIAINNFAIRSIFQVKPVRTQ